MLIYDPETGQSLDLNDQTNKERALRNLGHIRGLIETTSRSSSAYAGVAELVRDLFGKKKYQGHAIPNFQKIKEVLKFSKPRSNILEIAAYDLLGAVFAKFPEYRVDQFELVIMSLAYYARTGDFVSPFRPQADVGGFYDRQIFKPKDAPPDFQAQSRFVEAVSGALTRLEEARDESGRTKPEEWGNPASEVALFLPRRGLIDRLRVIANKKSHPDKKNAQTVLKRWDSLTEIAPSLDERETADSSDGLIYQLLNEKKIDQVETLVRGALSDLENLHHYNPDQQSDVHKDLRALVGYGSLGTLRKSRSVVALLELARAARNPFNSEYYQFLEHVIGLYSDLRVQDFELVIMSLREFAKSGDFRSFISDPAKVGILFERKIIEPELGQPDFSMQARLNSALGSALSTAARIKKSDPDNQTLAAFEDYLRKGRIYDGLRQLSCGRLMYKDASQKLADRCLLIFPDLADHSRYGLAPLSLAFRTFGLGGDFNFDIKPQELRERYDGANKGQLIVLLQDIGICIDYIHVVEQRRPSKSREHVMAEAEKFWGFFSQTGLASLLERTAHSHSETSVPARALWERIVARKPDLSSDPVDAWLYQFREIDVSAHRPRGKKKTLDVESPGVGENTK